MVDEHGLEALTFRLAERIGVKAPSLYNHFEDRAIRRKIAVPCSPRPATLPP